MKVYFQIRYLNHVILRSNKKTPESSILTRRREAAKTRSRWQPSAFSE